MHCHSTNVPALGTLLKALQLARPPSVTSAVAPCEGRTLGDPEVTQWKIG